MIHDTHPQSITLKRTPNEIVHNALIFVKNKKIKNVFERKAMSREYCASVCNRPHWFMRVCPGMAYSRQLGVKTFPP